MRHSLAPVASWKQRRRHGIVMSQKQMKILQFLAQSKRDGFEFVDLSTVKGKTLRVMAEFDWIFASPVPDGTRHKITARGLNVLHIFEQPTRHFNDLCPSCCERPKHRYSTGRKAGYCRECLSSTARRRYKLRIYGVRHDRLCSRCHKFPVHVRASGRAITYCLHCKNVLGRREKRRMHKRNIQRIANGELLPCRREGCNEQRYHSANSVYDWCYAHYREYINEHMRRKVASKPKKPLDRPKKAATS